MRSPTSHRLKTCVACVAAILSALTGCTNPWLQPSVPSDPPPGSAIEYRQAPPSRPKGPPAPKTRPGQLPTAPATVLEPKGPPAGSARTKVRYEDITRAPGPVSEDHDALALEVGDETPSTPVDADANGVPQPSRAEPQDRDDHDASDFDEDLSDVKLSDLALEDRPERRDVSGRVVTPRTPKRPETLDPSIYDARFTPEGIAFPYPTTKMFRGFGPCRGTRHHHEGIDLGGVGPDWGVGTPIRSMAKAEVTFIGLGEDNPDDFGLPDKRKGEALRGDRMLPRSRFIEPYGDVFFFTRKKGRWRSGNIVVTKALEGPLAGHVIRYLHLGGVHPDIEVGRILEAGEELGVMGGTGVQESAPHLHLDITAPNGRRVDVAPLLGLPPTASCKVSDEPAKEARTTSRKPEERSRLNDKDAEEEGASTRHESLQLADEGDVPTSRGTARKGKDDDLADGDKAKNDKAKAKDDKPKAKDDKKTKDLKAKDDEDTDRPSDSDDSAPRATLRAGTLKVSKCKTTKRAEDFGSGRHDAHAVAIDLEAGQVLTVELMRGEGAWKPRLEVVGDSVDAKSLASGKIGGKAVSSIRAKADGKVQIVVSGWDRGRPPKDASYTLKIAEKCRR